MALVCPDCEIECDSGGALNRHLRKDHDYSSEDSYVLTGEALSADSAREEVPEGGGWGEEEDLDEIIERRSYRLRPGQYLR